MKTIEYNLMAQLKTRIEQKNYSLPTIPQATFRIMELLADPQSSIAEMEKVIAFDPILAGQILKISNSCLYGARVEVTSLKNAIVRLGRKQIRSVILMMSTKSCLIKGKTLAPMQKMWKDSVACAFCCQVIAKKIKLDREELFTVGLLHNIGRLMILSLLSELVKESGSELDFNPELLEMVYDVYHLDIAEKILASWQIPQRLIEIVHCQAVALKSDTPEETNASILQPATGLNLSQKLCRRITEPEASVEELPELQALAIAPEAVAPMLAELEEIYRGIEEFV